MKKFKSRKTMAFLLVMTLLISSFVSPFASYADEYTEALSTPADLILNRGHIEALSFGGPMGLSWTEVENRETFTVFAFRHYDDIDPSDAYVYADGIDALYLNINEAFSYDLSDGPFWFRVQAVADGFADSHLSEPMGPFWYNIHSDEFAHDPVGSLAIFSNPEIPVIVLDARRPVERESQGNVVGDTHVPWPNAAAVEEGITHTDFQDAVLEVWQNFIDNYLTDEQRANLDADLGYKDIHIFVY